MSTQLCQGTFTTLQNLPIVVILYDGALFFLLLFSYLKFEQEILLNWQKPVVTQRGSLVVHLAGILRAELYLRS